ncbi:hypothetical protein TNCV_2187951 [Trichonephila clavipes]|nr:hypothetical protein TNCV_2187951 [Trichonephila clavipes]
MSSLPCMGSSILVKERLNAHVITDQTHPVTLMMHTASSGVLNAKERERERKRISLRKRSGAPSWLITGLGVFQTRKFHQRSKSRRKLLMMMLERGRGKARFLADVDGKENRAERKKREKQKKKKVVNYVSFILGPLFLSVSLENKDVSKIVVFSALLLKGVDSRELCQLINLHMTATTGSDVVQSGRPIFDDFFQHLWPYIGNNTANVVFQMVKRLWLIRIDQ